MGENSSAIISSAGLSFYDILHTDFPRSTSADMGSVRCRFIGATPDASEEVSCFPPPSMSGVVRELLGKQERRR